MWISLFSHKPADMVLMVWGSYRRIQDNYNWGPGLLPCPNLADQTITGISITPLTPYEAP